VIKINSYINIKEISIDELGKWLEYHKNDKIPLFIWDKYNNLEIKFKELFNLGYPDFIIKDKLNIDDNKFNELFNKVL
jgi:hypothetical protein